MKPVSEVRKENLELLIAELGSLKAVAELGETSEIYLSQIRNSALDQKTGKPRSMGSQIARRLEKSKGHGWMDKPHDGIDGYMDQFHGMLLVMNPAVRERAALEAVKALAMFLPGGSRQP